MKTLFLDIDGVVAVPEFCVNGLWAIEPSRVERLNRVVQRTGCAVVLSSTWRFAIGVAETQRRLVHAGARFCLSGSTPKTPKAGFEACRGDEISQWLKKHGGVTRFAIVDDCPDMGPHRDRLVQTRPDIGIQDEDVERLVRLLGENDA